MITITQRLEGTTQRLEDAQQLIKDYINKENCSLDVLGEAIISIRRTIEELTGESSLD